MNLMETIDDALNHLSQSDKRFKSVIDQFGKPNFEPETNYLKSLVRSIIYQQLSGKSASAIYNRFIELFNEGDFPNENDILSQTIETYRSIGLSIQKSTYIKEIAKASLEEKIQLNSYPQLSDDEIRNELIQVKGIGPWTIDMFLMFTLNRMDVLPTNDLGIQKGFMIIFKLDDLPNPEFMIENSENWKPYRTIACWYLWKLVDGPIEW
ncbi:MAG: DNA-3-methyladenine glycosylase 2 family protein [Candidatus Marinimicrobia bacterium]|nr:DNA-3-methyladenine glycosylase 2 family protein [Candidatus Neomarinimicrobiota bacterium]